MKSSLRFYFTVFVMLMTLLNCQYTEKASYRNFQRTKSQKPYEYKKVYSNQNKIKSGSFGDVSLVQKVPFTLQVDENKDYSKSSFIIDARPISSPPFVNEQKINLVIRLVNRQQSDSIKKIVKGLQIEQDQWNKEKGQFLGTVFKIDQLAMQRHNQFYSIILPTLQKGKYIVTLTDIEKFNKPVKLQILYFQVNHSGWNKNFQSSSSFSPIDTSIQSSLILPYGQTVRIPISSPQQNMILSVQSCSFQSPQVYYSQNDSNSQNMFQLRDHNKELSIFLMKSQQYPYRSNIYFKSIHSPQLYFNIKYMNNSKKFINSERSLNQFLLKVHKNPLQLFKRNLTFSQKIQSPISYIIKGNDIQITYKKVYPDQKSFFEYDTNKLNSTKIIYKLYVSSSQSALAKRSLCDMRSYENGQQIIVFQKIIQQQSLNEIKQKNKRRQQIQKVETTKISFWELKKQLQKIGPQLYLNMKVYITNEDTLISSGQSRSQSIGGFNNQETFHFQPIKVDLPQESWLFFQDIKFWKLMWGFIIFCLLVFFTLFLIQSALRNWKQRMIKEIIQNEMRSPRIVISKPKIVETHENSLADSYGFYPSPPASSSNIIQPYGFGSDMIIEDMESKQKSPRKSQIIYEPLSPTYF